MKFVYKLNGKDIYYQPSDIILSHSTLFTDLLEHQTIGGDCEETYLSLPDEPNAEMLYQNDIYYITQNDIQISKCDGDGLYTPSKYKNMRKEYYDHPDVPDYDSTFDYFAYSIQNIEEFLNGNKGKFNETYILPLWELERIYWHADFLGIDKFTTHIENLFEKVSMYKDVEMWCSYLGIPDVLTYEQKNIIAKDMGWEDYPL